MSLTTNQKETIIATLRAKSDVTCPFCHQNQWTINEEIVSATSVSLGGTTAIGGPFIPMVQLVCNNCGFVSHHALGALGIKLKD